MLEPIRVEGRTAHGDRCAYCHDRLDGPNVRCELCGVECHADCASQLGRCPTLGCARSVVVRPLVAALGGAIAAGGALGAHGTTGGRGTAADRTRARGPGVRDVPGLPTFAGALASALATMAVVGLVAGARFPTPASLELAAAAVILTLVLVVATGQRIVRLARWAHRLPQLGREPATTGVLVVQASELPLPRRARRCTPPRLRFEARLQLEGRPSSDEIALEVLPGVDEPWVLHGQKVPVRVRGPATGPWLLATAAGHHALVVPRVSRATVAPADGVRARARRGWR